MAIGDSNREKRLLVYNKCNGRCAYCGCDLNSEGYYGFHMDHIIPKRRYKNRNVNKSDCGTDEINNLLPCCQSCNSCKSDLSLEEFRARIYDRVYRLNKYSSEYQIAKRFGLVNEKDINIQFHFEKLNNG